MKRNVYLKIVGIAVLAGWVCIQTASAQEVQGKVINDYAKLLGETFTEQEKVDEQLNGQRTELSEEMKKYSEAVDGSQTRVEKLENQTDLTATMVDLNRVDAKQVSSTKGTCIKAYQLTRQAGEYLRSGSVRSKELQEQIARTETVIQNVIPVIEGMQFADPEKKAELQDSLLLLSEYNEIIEAGGVNTPAMIDKMMNRFEDTIAKLSIVEKLLEQERQALVVATHAQLVAAAEERLKAFAGGEELGSVAIGMAENIKDRRACIRQVIPDGAGSSTKVNLDRQTRWSNLKNKYK